MLESYECKSEGNVAEDVAKTIKQVFLAMLSQTRIQNTGALFINEEWDKFLNGSQKSNDLPNMKKTV